MSTRSRTAPSAPCRAGAPAWLLRRAALAAGLTALTTLATAATGATGLVRAGAAGAVGAVSRSSAAFTLVDQTEWVVAPKAPAKASSTPATAPSVPFDLGLAARGAPAGATIEAVLYPRLRSRYALESDVRNGPRGSALTTTTPVAYDSLPPDPHSAGAASLDLSVVQAASTGQGGRIGLACAPPTGTGTCTGVYPVVVELRRSGGEILHRFTTFLTYVAGRSTHPLELAWVVPVDAPVTLSRHPSGPAEGIEPLGAADASALETLVAQLRASSVPVTLDLSPETLQELERAGPDGRAADTALADLSSTQAADQVLASPYVPVDLGALAGAGELTEIGAQLAAGATVLRRLHVKTSAGPSPWVQRGPVGGDIVTGLAEVGTTRLVLPDADLAPTSDATSVGTWVSTFSLARSRTGPAAPVQAAPVQAAETDTWLDGQFTSLHDDPALAATQLLADLAMVHFERPDTAEVRGMVALPPARWVADPEFDHVLLDALAEDPVVEPVTLSRFFGSVTADGTRELLASGSGPGLERSFARAVSRARSRLSAFDDAVAGRPRPAVLSQLADLLLAAEDQELPARRRAAGVSTVEHLLRAQLDLVSFARTTVTLTARTGWIPVTIESRASYTLTGTLSVSGDKFVFPHESSRHLVRLDHSTNVSRVDVLARTSGDLPLDVTFTSPGGQLVIARGLLTVRSTATSLLGIVLTAVALAVLLVWWARTWRSGRRRRRLRRAAELRGGAAAP